MNIISDISMNLAKCANKLSVFNSGRLNFSDLGEYDYVNNDYSTSLKMLTFADDKKARREDLKNIGKDFRKAIELI